MTPATREERDAARHLMQWLLSALRPRTLVAIGRDAESALAAFGLSAEGVRHPSYGGQNEFIARMTILYDFRPPPDAIRGPGLAPLGRGTSDNGLVDPSARPCRPRERGSEPVVHEA